MMTSTNKSIKWGSQELARLKTFVTNNSEDLISNMLMNIVVGCSRFKNASEFFINLGSYLSHPPQVCKSKFRELEKLIYTNFLGVSEEFYDLFCFVRKKKSCEVNYNFNNIFTSSNNNSLEIKNILQNTKSISQQVPIGIIFYSIV